MKDSDVLIWQTNNALKFFDNSTTHKFKAVLTVLNSWEIFLPKTVDFQSLSLKVYAIVWVACKWTWKTTVTIK